MAITLEPVVRTYYEKLEEGKIMGRRCPKCGHIAFPAVYACNECGNYETEWYEMSGKAKVKTMILPGLLSSRPDMNEFAPYCFSEVQFEEGPSINACVLGVKKKTKKALADKLPVDAHAVIVQRGEGELAYKTIMFELDEEV